MILILWPPFDLYDAQAFTLPPNSGLASFSFVFLMNFITLRQYAFVFLHRPALKTEKMAGSHKRSLKDERRFIWVEAIFPSIGALRHVLSDKQAGVAWRS
jgi:hypothetical protein